jgi:hypothetical protein
MRLLLSQAQQMLAEWVDYGTCATDPRVTTWINMAIERLMPMLNPDKTIGRYKFPLVANTITMPRDVKTVLASYIDCPDTNANTTSMCGCRCDLRQLVAVRSRWYEYLPGGPISFTGCSPNVLFDLGSGWSTFADINEDTGPMYIRVYADAPQAALEGYVDVVGNDADGNPIQSLNNGVYRNVAQIPIPIQGENYKDSDVAFSSFISITKPSTVSRIKLYALSLDKSEQTPIAVYAPDEVAPDYRRYQLNWCVPDPGTTITVTAKRQQVPTTDPDADLLITNIGALKNAMQAIKYENAGAPQLADSHWQRAARILETETRDYDGDYMATVQLQAVGFCGGDIWNLH